MKKSVYASLSIRLSILICVVVLMPIGNSVNAELPEARTFTSSQFNIVTMVNDQQFLWAGTNGQGLLRINKNSNEIMHYTASNSGLGYDDVRALAFDSQGALIVGTSRGDVNRCMEDGATWESLPGTGTEIMRDGISIDNQGIIWVYSQTGILRLTGENWETVVNRITGSITSDLSGDIWLFNNSPNLSTCGEAWICQYVNGGLQAMVPLSSLCLENLYSQYFVVDSKNAWIGASGELIKVASGQIFSYPVAQDSINIKSINALAVDKNDVLMAAVKKHQIGCDIYFYDQINDNGEPFDSLVYSIPGNISITASCADLIKGFWLASLDGKIIKVSRSDDPVTISLGNSILPGNSVTALIVDKADNLWAAITQGQIYNSNNGIVRFDGTEWSNYPGDNDTLLLGVPSAFSLDSSGTLWAGFSQPIHFSSIQSGLASFNGQNWRTLERNHFSYKGIAADKNGNLWLACQDGVYRYDGTNNELLFETVYSSELVTALGTTVNTIALDHNDIPWIGTGLGVKRYENEIWVEDTVIKNCFAENMERLNVNTIVFDHKGTAWIGTSSGLFIDSAGTCTHIDTTDGVLPHSSVQCIAISPSNEAWIGTKRGVVYFDGTNSVIYNSENSVLIDNDITAVAIAKNSGVWIGTRTGGLTVLPHSGFQNHGTSVIKSQARSSSFTCSVKGNRNSRIFISTAQPCAIELSLLSLDGKLIKRFQSASSLSRTASFVWDGTDRFNKKVSGGVYMGLVKSNGKRIGDFTVLRY